MEQVFCLLTEYDRLPSLVRGVNSARVLVREGDIAVVELRLEGLKQPLVMEVVETRAEELAFAQVDSYRGRGCRGRCVLTAADNGTDLDLELEVDLAPFARRPFTAVLRRFGWLEPVRNLRRARQVEGLLSWGNQLRPRPRCHGARLRTGRGQPAQRPTIAQNGAKLNPREPGPSDAGRRVGYPCHACWEIA